MFTYEPLSAEQCAKILRGAQLVYLKEIAIVGLTARSKGAILRIVDTEQGQGWTERGAVHEQRLPMVSPLHIWVGKEIDLRNTAIRILRARSSELKLKCEVTVISTGEDKYIEVPCYA